MYKKLLATAVIVAALPGCSTAVHYPFGIAVADTATQKGTASFTQWNEEYAVTASHVAWVNDVAFTCEAGCDLKFFKHKATGPVIEWRNRVPNEEVVAVGLNEDRIGQVRTGKDINISVRLSDNSPYIYYTHSAKTQGGMSGGPVYGKDRKVIGMILGSTTVVENGTTRYASVYMPYSLVQQQWAKFQAQAGSSVILASQP